MKKIFGLLLLSVALLRAAPTITVQPSAIVVVAGNTALFAVVAICVPSCSYQWKKGGASIGGATSISYTTPATIAADDHASFTVAVTDGGGTTNSAGAVLSVFSLPAVSVQPANISAGRGSGAVFSVSANGSGTLSYQWKKNGVSISGATSASYTVSKPSRSDTGSYTAVITNDSGNVTSAGGRLTINGFKMLEIQHRMGWR